MTSLRAYISTATLLRCQRWIKKNNPTCKKGAGISKILKKIDFENINLDEIKKRYNESIEDKITIRISGIPHQQREAIKILAKKNGFKSGFFLNTILIMLFKCKKKLILYK